MPFGDKPLRPMYTRGVDNADTCDGRVCISAARGVTELSGNFAPGVTVFAQ